MKKYIVMVCCEREMSLIGVYDFVEEAKESMCKDFLRVLNDKEYELNDEDYGDINKFDFLSDDENASICEESAWFTDSYNYDWKIIEIGA